MIKNESRQALVVIGSVLAGSAAIAYLLGRLQPRLVMLEPGRGSSTPYMPPDVRPDPDRDRGIEPFPVGPVQLSGDILSLEPGGRYLASVALSGFLVRSLANSSRVREQAEKQGFTNVVVTEGPRPPLAQADYQIEGTYVGSPRTLGRSQGNGAVTIVDAWRIG